MSFRVLLIGAGAIAHHHAAAARLLPGVSILAADPSVEARTHFLKAFPEATMFETPEDLLGAAPPDEHDIAVVAVPPWLHAPMAILALEAGFHTLCEKPIARTSTELDAILGAAARNGRRIGDCCVRFNGQPSLVRAREILAQGELGPLNVVRMVHRRPRARPGIEYQPSSRWFLNREMSGGGVLMDWSVYDFAMLFDVLRPVGATVRSAWTGRIAGTADPDGVEVESHAIGMLDLDLPDGTTVPVIYERGNGVNGPAMAELWIEGRHGGVGWQWLPPYEDGFATVTRYVDQDGALVDEVERLEMAMHPHFHHVPLLGFVDHIQGRDGIALDADGIRFHAEVIEAFYEVAQAHRPVTVTSTRRN